MHRPQRSNSACFRVLELSFATGCPLPDPNSCACCCGLWSAFSCLPFGSPGKPLIICRLSGPLDFLFPVRFGHEHIAENSRLFFPAQGNFREAVRAELIPARCSISSKPAFQSGAFLETADG